MWILLFNEDNNKMFHNFKMLDLTSTFLLSPRPKWVRKLFRWQCFHGKRVLILVIWLLWVYYQLLIENAHATSQSENCSVDNVFIKKECLCWTRLLERIISCLENSQSISTYQRYSSGKKIREFSEVTNFWKSKRNLSESPRCSLEKISMDSTCTLYESVIKRN